MFIAVRRLTVLAIALYLLLQPAALSYAYPEKWSDDSPSARYSSTPSHSEPSANAASSPAPAAAASASSAAAPQASAAAKSADMNTEPDTPLTYVVNSGDTLFKIARAFDLEVANLQEYNGLRDPGKLKVGQKLMIPALPVDVPALDGKEPVIQKVLSSTLTAYTSGYESTGKRPGDPAYGITYSGAKAEDGRTVAVDPSIIPLGSTVYIEGIGLRKAEDTGSAIKGAKIDVYISDLDQAQSFGVKKNVKVFVLSAA